MNELYIDREAYIFGTDLLKSINGGTNATGTVVNGYLTFRSGSINEKASPWKNDDLHLLHYNISGTTNFIIVSKASQITIVAPPKNNKNR